MIIILAGALMLMFAFLIVVAYRLDVVTAMVAQHDEEIEELYGDDCDCDSCEIDEIEIANMMRELDSLNKKTSKTPVKGKKVTKKNK